jgi:hypothetical protein
VKIGLVGGGVVMAVAVGVAGAVDVFVGAAVVVDVVVGVAIAVGVERGLGGEDGGGGGLDGGVDGHWGSPLPICSQNASGMEGEKGRVTRSSAQAWTSA